MEQVAALALVQAPEQVLQVQEHLVAAPVHQVTVQVQAQALVLAQEQVHLVVDGTLVLLVQELPVAALALVQAQVQLTQAVAVLAQEHQVVEPELVRELQDQAAVQVLVAEVAPAAVAVQVVNSYNYSKQKKSGSYAGFFL